jgi:hypothetical protein
MTCTEVRALLPVHLYRDLLAADDAAVTQHLRECATCQAEAAALNRVRSALDATPTPTVHVNVPALFNKVAERNVRRWRRLAIAGAALAAGLLIVLGLRLHLTIGNGQIVIAWGGMVSRESPPSAPASALGGASRLNALDERVQLLQELTRALAADIESRDRQRSTELDAMRVRVDTLQQYAARQWADAERTMNALYVAQFKRSEEKSNP